MSDEEPENGGGGRGFWLSAVFKASSVVRCVSLMMDLIAGRSDCVVKRFKFDAVHGESTTIRCRRKLVFEKFTIIFT